MCKTVIEYAWRVTQQIIVCAPDQVDLSNSKGWGSGFFLVYRKHLFFVTADHCFHSDDYEEGRLGFDDKVYIYNNIVNREEFNSIATPLGGFFYYDKMDPQCPEILDLQDFAFSMISETFKAPFLTHELRYSDGTVCCEAAKNKFIIKEESIAPFSQDHYYVSVGTCLNKIRNGMILDRHNAIHVDLRLRGFDNDGNAILDYQYGIREDHWTGLSGGPIIDDECRLSGILIRVSEYADTVTVVPMEKVLRFMDYAIRYEEDNKEKKASDVESNVPGSK